jgi:hypothetical protein
MTIPRPLRIARLLELGEKALMEAEDPMMRERLIGLKLQRVGDPSGHASAGCADRQITAG